MKIKFWNAHRFVSSQLEMFKDNDYLSAAVYTRLQSLLHEDNTWSVFDGIWLLVSDDVDERKHLTDVIRNTMERTCKKTILPARYDGREEWRDFYLKNGEKRNMCVVPGEVLTDSLLDEFRMLGYDRSMMPCKISPMQDAKVVAITLTSGEYASLLGKNEWMEWVNALCAEDYRKRADFEMQVARIRLEKLNYICDKAAMDWMKDYLEKHSPSIRQMVDIMLSCSVKTFSPDLAKDRECDRTEIRLPEDDEVYVDSEGVVHIGGERREGLDEPVNYNPFA